MPHCPTYEEADDIFLNIIRELEQLNGDFSWEAQQDFIRLRLIETNILMVPGQFYYRRDPNQFLCFEESWLESYWNIFEAVMLGFGEPDDWALQKKMLTYLFRFGLEVDSYENNKENSEDEDELDELEYEDELE